MEFKIQHVTKMFKWGINIPVYALLIMLVLFISFGFTIENYVAFMIFLSIAALEFLIMVIFAILSFMESIFGSKIIIHEDHVEIRLILRRKKIYYKHIEEGKYSHYSYIIRNHRRQYYAPGREVIRAQLAFYLTSGKVIIVNDDADSYQRMKHSAMVRYDIDPDENVNLYKAYQCFRSSYDHYWYPPKNV